MLFPARYLVENTAGKPAQVNVASSCTGLKYRQMESASKGVRDEHKKPLEGRNIILKIYVAPQGFKIDFSFGG
jgi:hypothetical protein